MSAAVDTIADIIPLTFWIGGLRIRALRSFRVTTTLKSFLDDAQLTLANPLNSIGVRHLSTNLKLGDEIEVKWDGEALFTGRVEVMSPSRSDVSADPQLTVSGRDLLADASETDAEPKPERTVTDNQIIQEVFGGSFTYDLEPPVTHKKFSIHSGETAEKAAERVAKLGGFMLWAEGRTIKKAKPKESGASVLSLDASRGHLASYRITQSIRDARSKLIAYAASDKNEKIKEQKTVDLTMQLRTVTYTPTVERVSRYTQDKGDQAETRVKAEELLDSVLPVEEVEVEIDGLQKVPLNELIGLRIPEEAIDRQMLCVGRVWDMGTNGRRSTTLSLILPGRKSWR